MAEHETTIEKRNVRMVRRLARTWIEEELVAAVAFLPEQSRRRLFRGLSQGNAPFRLICESKRST